MILKDEASRGCYGGRRRGAMGQGGVDQYLKDTIADASDDYK